MPYTGPEPTKFQIERQLHRMLQLSPFTERPAQADLLKAMVEIGLTRKHVTEMALLKRVYPGNDDIDASVVRVQAKNLRKTVAEYYSGSGATDLVIIHFPEPKKNKTTTDAVTKTNGTKERLPTGKNYKPLFEYNLKHDVTLKYFTAWTKMCGPHLSLIPEAMQTFAQIVLEEPEYADASFAIADGFCFLAMIDLIDHPDERADALERAETMIEAGRQFAPETWHFYASGAFLKLVRGDISEASRLFATALAINPEMTEGHPAFLLFYVAAKGMKASDLMASRALELSWNPDLQALHGRMLEWSGKPAEAERYYRQAIDLAPNNGLCHLGLARLLAETGKSEEAKKHRERAELLLGPENLGMWLAFEKSVNRSEELD